MNIVVLGATGGIGAKLSLSLSEDNNLFLGSRDQQKFLNLQDEIKYNQINSKKIGGSQVDVTDFDSIKNFIDESNNFLGSIDCIINCVGSLLLKPAHATSLDDLNNVFSTNLFSCFGVLKFGFPYLKKNGGSVLFFSSAAAKVGLKNHEAISSAKAAISALALTASATYANYNIRVNAIAPGLVDTPLTEKIVNNKMSLDYSKNLHGLKRIGKPENFIPIVRSVIDKNSDWITGQTICVDGGLSNVK
jgi:NAD(P)-dependent dehydrogenase (short-subunit alcohol dehydrogenase family)